MNYELFYRKGIDTSAEKKFALLVFVYGAPEYQNVDGLWTTDFVKAREPSYFAKYTKSATSGHLRDPKLKLICQVVMMS